MHAILRGVTIYLVLLIIFRVAGKRTLSQITPFELVLLLIISETIQQAMVHDDKSLTTGLLLVLTLVGMSVGLSFVKQRFPTLDKWLDGQPLVIVEKGAQQHERMQKARVDEGDILEAGRMSEGLAGMDEVEYAVLERSGAISVIPKSK